MCHGKRKRHGLGKPVTIPRCYMILWKHFVSSAVCDKEWHVPAGNTCGIKGKYAQVLGALGRGETVVTCMILAAVRDEMKKAAKINRKGWLCKVV